jgi:hypothetical protein
MEKYRHLLSPEGIHAGHFLNATRNDIFNLKTKGFGKLGNF